VESIILIFAAIFLALLILCAAAFLGDKLQWEWLATAVLSLVIVGVLAWIIAFPLVIINWKSAEMKCRLINERFKTEYTIDQMFWSGDVVDSILRQDSGKIDRAEKILLKVDGITGK
jgi:hypothetical protein